MVRCILAGALASPSAMAWPDGLLVVNRGDHSTNLIHLPDGKTGEHFGAGVGPAEISVSSGGNLAAVSIYGLDNASGNRIAIFDLASKAPPRFINLGAYRHPYGIAWRADNRHVLVVSRTRRAVLEIDTETGAVERVIPTHQEDSRLLALDERRGQAYVVNRASGSLSVIDLIGGRFARMVKVGEGSEGIAMSPDGHQIWVVNGESNNVTVLDADTLRPIMTLPTENSPSRIAFTPDGAYVGVTNSWSSTVSLYDARDPKPIGTVALRDAYSLEGGEWLGGGLGWFAHPTGIAAEPQSRSFYVTGRYSGVVYVIDIAQRKVVKTFPAGSRPNAVAWIPAAADNAISTAK